MAKLLQSGEDYLETILILKERKERVRAVDIVEELGYSKSSVSRAVNILKAKGLISIDPNGHIEFTDDGIKQSEAIYYRHKMLTQFLQELGVEQCIAEQDACRIEHFLSPESLEAIKQFLEKK